MRAHLTLNFLVSAFLALTGCVTHPTPQRSANSATDKNDRSSPHDKALAKKGQKTLPETSKLSLDIPPNSQTNSASKDLTKTFNRLNDPSMQLMDEDIQTATALHPAAKASMEEAVLVLAQLRLLKTQLDQSSQFQSHDLYDKNSPPEASSTKKISMEKLFRDLDLDLLNSFTTNSNLKNLPTLALLKSLLDKTENSKDFTTSIQSLIDLEAQKWAALQKPNNTPDAQQTPLPPPPSPPVASATAAPSPETSAIGSSEVHTAATDLKRSDTILLQAQKYADKGEFRQAIDQAARIENSDPFFDQAKEKIKVYSNRAVQDLRQKAAQAFQNAMPVADDRAKLAYLKQAKDLLELALKEYPTADQLDTVRENLAVITRDLSGLERDTAQDSIPKTQ